MKKKLLFIGTHLGYELGDGTGRKIDGQVAALRRDYDVELIYPRYRRTAAGKILSLIGFQCRVLRRLGSADIIYYRISAALVLLNLGLLLGGRRRIVLELNSLPSEYRNQGHTIQYLLSLYLDRHLYPRASRLLTITEEQKAWLEQEMGLRDVAIMDNGYEREDSADPPSADLEPLLIERVGDRSRLTGVMVSTFKKWHGIDRIVTILRDLPGLRLLLVGDGPEKPAIEGLVRELQLDDRVTFLGFRNLPDLQLIYRYSDFGLGSFAADRVNLTSLASLKMREYLAFGLPVVVANDDKKIMGQPFVHRYADLDALQEFLGRVRSFDPRIIAEFAEKHLSWSSIMRAVMQGLG
jgi:glycosyltransferase involved in cell wall biosynthesis